MMRKSPSDRRSISLAGRWDMVSEELQSSPRLCIQFFIVFMFETDPSASLIGLSGNRPFPSKQSLPV